MSNTLVSDVAIDVRIDGDEAILAVRGNLTLERESLLSDKVRALRGEAYHRFVLDLPSVSYVDSTAIGKIVQLYVTLTNYSAVGSVDILLRFSALESRRVGILKRRNRDATAAPGQRSTAGFPLR